MNGEKNLKLSDLSVGDKFKIGEHDFIVLEQMDGRAAVISKDFMAENAVFDENTRDYNKSSLKKLIEGKIQPDIEKEIGVDNLVEHEAGLMSVDCRTEFEPVKCKVRPISFDEARKFNSLLTNKELGNWYWTLTPWSTAERGWGYSVAVVSPGGVINRGDCYYDGGVRPFFILKSNIFVSKGE